MNDQIINLIKLGYEVHLIPLRTKSGLHHPKSATHMGIILLKRLPGVQRKGGQAYATGEITWDLLSDSKGMEIVLNDLQKKVDKVTLQKSVS